MPKVSIIIPNYNHARFLEQRLNTVLNQTYQDFEVIFLDDASTDNTQEVFAKYANHPRITKIFFNTQNSGSPFKQWNKGIKEAQGEYIWIAESDDYAELNFLEALVPILENNPKVGIAYCQSLIINEKGEKIGSYANWTKRLDKNRWEKDFENVGIHEVENYLLWQNTIPNVSAVLLRKSAYFEVGMAPTNMKMAGDWKLYLSVLKQYDISFVSSSLNYNRLHSQVSRIHDTPDKILQRAIEGYLILDFIFQQFSIKTESRYQSSFSLLNLWCNKIGLLDLFNIHSLSLIKNYFKTDQWKYQRIFYILKKLARNDINKTKKMIKTFVN